MPASVDPAIPLALQRDCLIHAPCATLVCFRHLRDVGGGRVYCMDHWSQWAEPGDARPLAWIPEIVERWADAHPGEPLPVWHAIKTLATLPQFPGFPFPNRSR